MWKNSAVSKQKPKSAIAAQRVFKPKSTSRPPPSSVALDPNYPQVREYLGEAYVIEGKYDLAKEQLSTIEKLCSKDTAAGGRTLAGP